MVYVDLDGVKRRFLKATATMPSGEGYPISDRASWEKLKDERLNLNDIKGRFPPNWDELVKEYRNRDYPLALIGYPHGFFGTLANLMGYENAVLRLPRRPGADPRHRQHLHRAVDRRVRGSAQLHRRGLRADLGRHLLRQRLDDLQGHGARVHAALLQALHQLPEGQGRARSSSSTPTATARTSSRSSSKAARPACTRSKRLRHGHRQGAAGVPRAADDGRHPQVGHQPARPGSTSSWSRWRRC